MHLRLRNAIWISGALAALVVVGIGMGARRSEDHPGSLESRSASGRTVVGTSSSDTTSSEQSLPRFGRPPSGMVSTSTDDEANRLSKLDAQSKMSELLLKALASSTATRLDVNLRLAEPYTQEPLSQAEQRALISQLQDPIVQLIEANGGTVTYRCEMLWCLSANLPASLVLDVARLPEVSILDIDQTEIPDPK